MKRTTFALAFVLMAFSGCSMGQNYGYSRPNIFQRMYARLHGNNNVGAPCASGNCASAPMMSAPMMSAPMVSDGGCESCNGGSTMGYESYEGSPVGEYSSPMPTNVYGGGMENVTPVPAR